MNTSSPQRLLLIRPSALGDVARTVPALASLKKAFPDSQIDWLVNEPFADAIRAHPDLNEVVPFPRQRFRGFRALPEILKYLKSLKSRRYDRVYDLQGLARSGLLAWSTRAPHRVGPADAREAGWLGYRRRVKIGSEVEHTVDRMLAILEGDGIPAIRDMRLYSPGEDQLWATEWLKTQAVETPFAVLAPGAQWLSKCWPADRYLKLADRLHDHGIRSVVLAGSKSDAAGFRPALAAHGNPTLRRFDLMGETGVGQLMAILERAHLVVANDSAALHLAAGLGTRCLGLFGPTDPHRVGPYRLNGAVACGKRPADVNYRAQRDDQSLMATLSVEEVEACVGRVLEAPPPCTQW